MSKSIEARRNTATTSTRFAIQHSAWHYFYLINYLILNCISKFASLGWQGIGLDTKVEVSIAIIEVSLQC